MGIADRRGLRGKRDKESPEIAGSMPASWSYGDTRGSWRERRKKSQKQSMRRKKRGALFQAARE